MQSTTEASIVSSETGQCDIVVAKPPGELSLRTHSSRNERWNTRPKSGWSSMRLISSVEPSSPGRVAYVQTCPSRNRSPLSLAVIAISVSGRSETELLALRAVAAQLLDAFEVARFDAGDVFAAEARAV